MDYTSLTPVHFRADNEIELQKKFLELKAVTDKMPNVITIYPRGSYVYAWVYLDERQFSAAPKSEPSKKKTKKKTKKKG